MPVKLPNILQKGFTLIEIIVGLVVLAISFTVLTNLVYPAVEQSADQLHQIRAAELGQSMLNEIQQKAFDDKSDKAGGIYRCGEDYNNSGSIDVAEQCSTVLGPESGEVRQSYDDVDDYNGLTYVSGEIRDSEGELLDLYTGYSMSVIVCNDQDYNGVCDASTSTAKLITVTITTPLGFNINFSTYRANF